MPKTTISQNQPAKNHSVVNESTNWLLWENRSKEVLAKCHIFSVNKIQATTRHGTKTSGNFYTLDCGTWVNIIAISDEGDVLMVEQYRHGIEKLTLEIPGGSVDTSDSDELTAAKRELREETGFIARAWSLLGKNHPNPALQNNLCYTFLAEGVQQFEQPQFDSSGTERINLRYLRLADVSTLIRSGIISHALVITAFHFLTLERPDLLKIF